jgi:hypothetical protein
MNNQYNYNTTFEVKYFNIERELNAKLDCCADDELGYTKEDVDSICKKLFVHEITSVFNVPEREEEEEKEKDEKAVQEIVLRMQLMVDYLNTYPAFFEQIHSLFRVHDTNTECLILFNYENFHVLHQCIIEYLTTQTISQSVLDMLKTNLGFLTEE